MFYNPRVTNRSYNVKASNEKRSCHTWKNKYGVEQSVECSLALSSGGPGFDFRGRTFSLISPGKCRDGTTMDKFCRMSITDFSYFKNKYIEVSYKYVDYRYMHSNGTHFWRKYCPDVAKWGRYLQKYNFSSTKYFKLKNVPSCIVPVLEIYIYIFKALVALKQLKS